MMIGAFQSGLPDGLFFTPKIPIWVNFGGPWNGTRWYLLNPFRTIYGRFVLFGVIWYSVRSFGIICGHLIYIVCGPLLKFVVLC
jgi:hypothetical protein